MSGILAIAAGLTGGISQGLEKRGERKRLEQARQDEMARFEQQMELQTQQVAIQEALAESRIASADKQRELAELEMQRAEKQLEGLEMVTLVVTNPHTGETRTEQVTQEELRQFNIAQAAQFAQGMPVSMPDGTVVTMDQADGARYFQDRARAQEAWESEILKQEAQILREMISRSVDGSIPDQALAAVEAWRDQRLEEGPGGSPEPPPLLSLPSTEDLVSGAGGGPEDAFLELSGGRDPYGAVQSSSGCWSSRDGGGDRRASSGEGASSASSS
jgi:hypothetical protein